MENKQFVENALIKVNEYHENKENNKLEMRKLSGQDTFLMLKIMSKTGAKDAVKEFLKKQGNFGEGKKSEEEYQKIGIEIMLDIADVVMGNLDNAQSDINKILANLCDVKVKEIEQLGFLEYNTLIMDFFKKEELKSFFKLIFSSIE